MPQYALAHHVFICVHDEHVVFLDVHKDRYFALEAARTAGLGSLVPDWPVSVSQPDAGLPSVIALLLKKGILVAKVECGKAASPISAEKPRGNLTAEDVDQAPRIGPAMVCRFIAAATRAALLLKYRTFGHVIDRVAGRLARATSAGRVPDIARTEGLVSAFATLRPFFFTAKDACLFDALALSEFLASYAVYPRWVFGVQARPFGAHCWLQLGDIVLNDTAEHVKHYSIIMVV